MPLVNITRFPEIPLDLKTDKNPAIQLFGRRFHKDQTPIEYLAEFLLVFASDKVGEGDYASKFPDIVNKDDEIKYWPADTFLLKYFAFFPSSKLETRHPIHQESFHDAIEDVKHHIVASDENKDLLVRALQSLFGGYVGVAGDRTWVTHTFIPLCNSLLGREIAWKHTEALKKPLKEWSDTETHFDIGKHLFLARGGELLFLQLLNLFNSKGHPDLVSIEKSQHYSHLRELNFSRSDLERSLSSVLVEAEVGLGRLADFIENALETFEFGKFKKPATLGWVPRETLTESYLFGCELLNICNSNLPAMQKLDFLGLLCCIQVLRTLCFQSARIDDPAHATPGFLGNYAWIVCSVDTKATSEQGKIAQDSFSSLEDLLYRALRKDGLYEDAYVPSEDDLDKADTDVYRLFRKLSKEIGLVVPLRGPGQRFVLPSHLIRFLVVALVSPGERIRLNEFYRRIFSHFGIAFAADQLGTALTWLRIAPSGSTVVSDISWIEEELRQGGFLIELSDAVSMILNPYEI